MCFDLFSWTLAVISVFNIHTNLGMCYEADEVTHWRHIHAVELCTWQTQEAGTKSTQRGQLDVVQFGQTKDAGLVLSIITTNKTEVLFPVIKMSHLNDSVCVRVCVCVCMRVCVSVCVPKGGRGISDVSPCLESLSCQFDPTFLYLLSCSSV